MDFEELVEIKKEIAQIEKKRSELAIERNKFNDEANKYEDKESVFYKRNANKVKELQSEINDLANEAKTKRIDLEDKLDEIKKSKINELERRKNKLEELNDTEKTNLTERNAEIKENIESKQKLIGNLESDFKKFQERKQKIENEMQEKSDIAKSILQDDLNKINNKITANRDEYNKYDEELKELKEELEIIELEKPEEEFLKCEEQIRTIRNINYDNLEEQIIKEKLNDSEPEKEEIVEEKEETSEVEPKQEKQEVLEEKEKIIDLEPKQEDEKIVEEKHDIKPELVITDEANKTTDTQKNKIQDFRLEKMYTPYTPEIKSITMSITEKGIVKYTIEYEKDEPTNISIGGKKYPYYKRKEYNKLVDRMKERMDENSSSFVDPYLMDNLDEKNRSKMLTAIKNGELNLQFDIKYDMENYKKIPFRYRRQFKKIAKGAKESGLEVNNFKTKTSFGNILKNLFSKQKEQQILPEGKPITREQQEQMPQIGDSAKETFRKSLRNMNGMENIGIKADEALQNAINQSTENIHKQKTKAKSVETEKEDFEEQI